MKDVDDEHVHIYDALVWRSFFIFKGLKIQLSKRYSLNSNDGAEVPDLKKGRGF